MATYSQDSQRLVIVADASVGGPAAPTIKGQVSVINAGGGAAALALGSPVKICFATGKAPVGSTNGATGKINLVSETITADMVLSVSAKAYAAPAAQVTTVNVGTAIPNNEYYLTLDFDEYGSTSVQNTVQTYGVYVSTATDTDATIAAGLAANINKNASRSGTARATASATGADITITAGTQAVIDFNNPFHVVRFATTLNGSFAADATVVATTAGSKGFGYGPEVANIEHFAQGSEANWTWGRYNEMYPRDLYTDPTATYDCVSLRLGTTKSGFGSNVTSKRQIDVFGKTGTLTALIGNLNTVLGAGTVPTP